MNLIGAVNNTSKIKLTIVIIAIDTAASPNSQPVIMISSA